MRHWVYAHIFTALCCAIFLLGACNRDKGLPAADWTAPVKVAQSLDGLGGNITLIKWRDAVTGWQPQADGGANYFYVQADGNSWPEQKLIGLPKDALADPMLDAGSGIAYFVQANVENEQLIVNVFGFRILGGIEIETQKWVQKQCFVKKEALFAAAPQNVRFDNMSYLGVDNGIINGTDWYLPYCISAITYSGNTTTHAPFNNGVLVSEDSGATWSQQTISDEESVVPTVCKTKTFVYFFATRVIGGNVAELWNCRRPRGGSWDRPNPATKTLGGGYGHYVALAENDTVHLCWSDCRGQTSRLSLTDPYRFNYAIAYSNRRDADSSWGKSVLLSKGMGYTYSPTMSVENDKIVVAWSGVWASPSWHSEDEPNDIFYVTSKDGGKSWSNPLKVTDRAKDGITSGVPSVVLQKGEIHLCYVQGKMNLKQVAPGLTKLNQPPWPIYYAHRKFPD